MKKLTSIMIAVLLMAWCFGTVQAQDIVALGVQGQALYGATHYITIDYADFSEDTADTAETLTLAVDAKQSVEFVAMILDAEFAAPTNTTLQVKIGDGTNDDYLMESTHIGEEGTAVWMKLAGGTAQTVDVTVTDEDVFVGLTSGDEVTNEVTVVTGVTAAFSEATLGKKVYTADDTIDFVFTPSTTVDALADFTAGSMRVYLKILDAR